MFNSFDLDFRRIFFRALIDQGGNKSVLITFIQPLVINSIDDMNALSTYSVSNSCENLKFMLMKDLNYTNQTFNPIGMNSSPYFNGIFDGNKHVISNISYT